MLWNEPHGTGLSLCLQLPESPFIDLCQIFLAIDLSVTGGGDTLCLAEKAAEVHGIVIADDRRYVANVKHFFTSLGKKFFTP